MRKKPHIIPTTYMYSFPRSRKSSSKGTNSGIVVINNIQNLYTLVDKESKRHIIKLYAS